MHVRFKKTMMLIVWSNIFKLCFVMIIFKFRQKPVFSEKTGFLLIIKIEARKQALTNLHYQN